MDDSDAIRRYYENAQSRSRLLGISNKAPLMETSAAVPSGRQNSMKTTSASPKRRTSTDRKQYATSPSVKNRAVALRTVNNSLTEATNAISIDAKENVDLALEINITTGPNVQVQVEVEEQELDSNGKVLNTTHKQHKQNISAEDELTSTPSSCIRDSSRNQLHRLGALYSNPQDMSSPVHRTETAFNVDEEHATKSNARLKKSTKLTELANSFNEWEDQSTAKPRPNKVDKVIESSNVTMRKSSESKALKSIIKSPRADSAPDNRQFSAEKKKEADYNKNSTQKQLVWDKNMVDSLESQGYTRRDTTHKRLEYDFAKESNDKVDSKAKPPSGASKGVVPKTASAVPSKVDVTKGLVSGRAAIFETNTQRATNLTTTAANVRHQKDPAEMSLKERMALFEKNKGEALIPKAALGMAPSVKQIMADKKPSENLKQIITTPQQPMISSTITSNAPTAGKINNFNRAVKADTCASGSGIRQTVAALLAAPATIAENRIASENRKIISQEMNVVLNRFNNKEPSSPPPAPPMPDQLFQTSTGKKRASDGHRGAVSPKIRRSLENVKPIKVNPPKSGHVYPALSDIESSTPENYTPEPPYTDDDNEQPIMERYIYSSQDEGEDEDSYMESEEEEANVSKRRSSGRHVHYADSSITSSNTESSEMDKYLNAAFDDDEDDEDNTASGKHGKMQKGSVSSNSFSYERKPLNRQHEAIYEEEAQTSRQPTSRFQSPIKSRMTVNSSDDNSVTLTHTVSFYRRQQNQNTPNVRKGLQFQNDQAMADDNTDIDYDDDKDGQEEKYINAQEDLVEQKIKSLMNSVLIQNQQIAQASNALNTCASTFEFSGSTESVVAEWKLLVATHSRKAALQEVQRLKVERCLRSADAPKEFGRLTVKDIVLPLREDYVKKVSEEKILGHHLVCLLKYNEHVLATRTIPTLPGLLAVKFPGELHLENVYSDFKMTLEIYGMIAQRESLPHEIKYHIRKEKKGVIKTPKGKKLGSNLIMPPTQSPAGPNAVRAPAFAYYGFVIFSLREVLRNTWTLNQVSAPDITPLVGTVHMKINCAISVNIEHKAFLTMFEDVSGFGAWHRRWCRLHGNILSYWKYPDDERSKPPIGSLDLSACEQQKIATAPREMCARLNTLMVELKRLRRDDDEDSMLLRTEGKNAYVRHLLSADTKEERDAWCAYFNKTLALMRAWGQC